MDKQNNPLDIVSAPQGVAAVLASLTNRISLMCPTGSIVGFRFDGKLHADVDVRTVEQAMAVEAELQARAEMFRNVRPKPPSSFLHRITAELIA
jgi:hypothetical protein